MVVSKNKKRKKTRKKKEENRLVLIILIIFCALSVGIVFSVKLAELNRLENENSKIKLAEIINIQKPVEPEKELEYFEGSITEIDLRKRKILVKISQPAELEGAKIYFFIKDKSEIVSAKKGEEISLDGLLIDDSIKITAFVGLRDRWEVKKMEIEPIEKLSGEVTAIEEKERKKLTLVRNFENSEDLEMNYTVLIDTRTKILIKDYRDAVDEEGAIDENKVIEKVGYRINIKEGSQIIVKNKEGVIPREAGEIEATNIDIILKED